MSKEMKLLYMNSFSRSGETLMLRTLNTHKNISILHQLKRKDEEIELQYDVFKKIKKFKPDTMKLTDKEASILGISEEADTLLVKNAIFLNQDQKYSFMLLRNPYSVYASYKKLAHNLQDPRQQMSQWAKNIDPNLVRLVKEGDFLDAVMSLYLKKVSIEMMTSQSIIKYENFISKPKQSLNKLLKELSIGWDPSVLYAHKQYNRGEKGHGGIKLWQPINGEKANALPSDLSDIEKDRIYAYCSLIMDKAGYRIKNDKLIF